MRQGVASPYHPPTHRCHGATAPRTVNHFNPLELREEREIIRCPRQLSTVFTRRTGLNLRPTDRASLIYSLLIGIIILSCLLLSATQQVDKTLLLHVIAKMLVLLNWEKSIRWILTVNIIDILFTRPAIKPNFASKFNRIWSYTTW